MEEKDDGNNDDDDHSDYYYDDDAAADDDDVDRTSSREAFSIFLASRYAVFLSLLAKLNQFILF